MHCMLDQGDFASGRIYVERGTGSLSWKGDVNLQIYGWGDFAWKRSNGKNVREVRSWVPPGRDAKIHCFGDKRGRIFLSTSEDADLNGRLLNCDLKQRGATDSALFSGLLGDHAGMCRRWLCPSPEGSRREAPFLLPRHCNPDVARDTQKHHKKQNFNGVK